MIPATRRTGIRMVERRERRYDSRGLVDEPLGRSGRDDMMEHLCGMVRDERETAFKLNLMAEPFQAGSAKSGARAV